MLFACAGASADDEQARALLDAFVTDVQLVSGSFSQTVTGSDGRVKERSSGRFAIERPARFEWLYRAPYEQRIVADGVNLWLYDVDLEQVTVRAQDNALDASPAGILGGGRDVLDAFEYQGSFETDGRVWVQLAALDEASDFRAVRLAFDEETGLLAAMELGDSLSQRTMIEFGDVAINVDVDPARFEFTPPEGVDVSGSPAGRGDAAPALPEARESPAVSGLG